MWGNGVVNWNVQPKPYLVNFRISWGYSTSLRHFCHLSASSLFSCLRLLRDCRPLADEGIWGEVVCLYKILFSVRFWQVLLDLWGLALCLTRFNCSLQHMAPYQLPEVLERYERGEVQLSHKAIKDVLRVTYTHPGVMMQSERILQ